jgi:hypothetical protein
VSPWRFKGSLNCWGYLILKPLLALWSVLQKMPTEGCRGAVSCAATSLGGMPWLRGSFPISVFGSFHTNDVVLTFVLLLRKMLPSPLSMWSWWVLVLVNGGILFSTTFQGSPARGSISKHRLHAICV